jgi:hypothetical protein
MTINEIITYNYLAIDLRKDTGLQGKGRTFLRCVLEMLRYWVGCEERDSCSLSVVRGIGA